MKKISFAPFIFICFSIFFSSCQKEISDLNTNTDTSGRGGTAGSDYYIKCKKDGVPKTYTENASANILNLSSTTNLSLFLVAGLPNSIEGFNISINFFNGATINPGSYTEGFTSLEYLVAAVYNLNSTNIVYGAGLMQTPSVKPLAITILTKTTAEMTGKFEGAFYKQNLNGNPSTEYILFTEGVFKLPIK